MDDSRVGRFWSVDPLASKYPHNSPYAFSENRLLDGVELEGLERAPLPQNLTEDEYESPLVRPEVKVADAWYLLNQIEDQPGLVVVYDPAFSPSFASYRPSDGLIRIWNDFFALDRSPGGRTSILYHESQHRLNHLTNAYPGAQSFIRVETDIVYYLPYTQKDIDDFTEFHIPLDPLGEKYEYTYSTSNAEREHRDVYLSQIAGHTNGLYDMSTEELDEASRNARQFDVRFKLALQYEQDNHLNPDGTEKAP